MTPKDTLMMFRFTLCCFFLMIIQHLPAQPISRPYENSRFVTADSVRMHYRIWNEDVAGPARSVVFIHGFTGSTFCWRKNVDTLASQGYRVVAVDLPSFGYSERQAGLNQSQSNRARLVWDLLAHVDGRDDTKWDVVGHSMGGGIAEAMALMQPLRTRSLVIVSGMVFTKNHNMTGAFVITAQNRHFRRVYSSLLENNFLTYNSLRRALKSAYGREPDSSEVMGYLTPLQIEGTAESIMGVWADAKEIEKLNSDSLRGMPVQVIWGTKDKWIPKRKGKSFARNVPGSKLDLISGAGHIPMETHPAMFNKLLLDFLRVDLK